MMITATSGRRAACRDGHSCPIWGATPARMPGVACFDRPSESVGGRKPRKRDDVLDRDYRAAANDEWVHGTVRKSLKPAELTALMNGDGLLAEVARELALHQSPPSVRVLLGASTARPAT